MKKVFVAILLAVLSLGVVAQNNPIKIVTYENAVGYWNNRTQQFEFQPYVKASITFNFYNDYVTVSDNNHSVYRIVEELPKKIDKDHTTTSARCLDEGNRSCTVGIMTYTDGSASIGVIYEDRMFLYIVQ